MASLEGEVLIKKAMWMYPKVAGANPSERWGHSACYYNGLIYIFGGCRGGVHFSDVLVCNLELMTWNILMTTGQGPRSRDSHSAVLVGHRMIVFGGTNGFKKVNDLYILDLHSREWSRPECHGNPPSSRESHTATLVNDEKLVIFGGSGEGESNYLNDLHVLDLKTMGWTSLDIQDNLPAPRDSHSAVAVGNRIFVYGGDSGDRYQRDVNVFDMNTLTWSKLDCHGPSPGARAGHASVSIGTKVYVIGGVRDKQYYNDVWVLDVITSSWIQLDICLPKPRGRFSHTATVTNLGIAIFGGCGEDERPLNELLILRIGVEHSRGYVDSSTSRSFRNSDYKERKMYFREAHNNLKKAFYSEKEDSAVKDAEELEIVSECSFRFSSDMLHPKRRRMSNSVAHDMKSEPDEHCLSFSRNLSPSQSDQELTLVKKINISSSSSQVHPIYMHRISNVGNSQPNYVPINRMDPQSVISRPSTLQDVNLSSEHCRNGVRSGACEVQCSGTESTSSEARKFQNLIGAEVHGQVDGAFDSGYLMTANVNGMIFRGVLFTPAPELVAQGAILGQHPTSLTCQTVNDHTKNHGTIPYSRHPQQQTKVVGRESHQSFGRESHQSFGLTQSRKSIPKAGTPLTMSKDSVLKSELQGVVLTLGGPGSDDGRSKVQ
ncbi:acyl-CoA-binding domain-containing protein 6-like isoform X3 [Olea europaea var. sylvestris]|uniref:acyl-CoA-binding domain-containing protein 6-like isoform X3 n=1 Tax=Olea europaea var. sylvestris TaxID=158386 RepID=UPI000C1D8612|nr:acyl-CoA-binding domain-containing protein 6-like isoform X3 [Olea europaea var. sylvestris]